MANPFLTSPTAAFFAVCNQLIQAAQVRDKKIYFYFYGNPHLHVRTRDVEQIAVTEEADRIDVRMQVNFLGLVGHTSPLPLHYTERILFDENESPMLLHFYDFFHQRLIELRYRLWQKYHGLQPTVLLSVAGLRDHTKAKELLPYVPWLLGGRGDKAQFCHLLARYFQFERVELVEFQLQRYPIAENQRCYLGQQACRVSVDAVVGAGLYSRQYHCWLRITLVNLMDVLPITKAYAELRLLLPFLLRAEVSVDIHLQSEMPLRASLGQASFLGWTVTVGQVGTKVVILKN